MTKLKPCRWCGGEAKIIRDKKTNFSPTLIWINCGKCAAWAGGGPIYWTSKQAIAAWNRRAKEKP